MRFDRSVALGGHISRSHPGLSSDYKEKLKTRKRREPERLALRWAKEQCKDMKAKTAEYRREIARLRKEFLENYY